MPDLSPQDLDLAARTLIGEAGQEPDLGKAGVAAVILNRLKSGNYGDSVAKVVLAPKQFTTWSDRPAELAAISPRSRAYQEAYNIVKNVAGGSIPDPTGGALNYANVDQVKKSGNTSAMKWIDGMTNVSQIGNHTFGNADGAGIPDYISASKVPDYISGFRNKSKTDDAPESQTVPAPDDQGAPDYISAFHPQKAESSGYQYTGSVIPVPEANMTPDQKADYEKSLTRAKTPLQRFRESIEPPIDPIGAVGTAASTVLDKAAAKLECGWTSRCRSPTLAPAFETFPSKVDNARGQ